jgi:hypothetical protein
MERATRARISRQQTITAVIIMQMIAAGQHLCPASPLFIKEHGMAVLFALHLNGAWRDC